MYRRKCVLNSQRSSDLYVDTLRRVKLYGMSQSDSNAEYHDNICSERDRCRGMHQHKECNGVYSLATNHKCDKQPVIGMCRHNGKFAGHSYEHYESIHMGAWFYDRSDGISNTDRNHDLYSVGIERMRNSDSHRDNKCK
jgi:hypothetical protein